MRSSAVLLGIAVAIFGARETSAQREHPISEVIRIPAGGIVARPGATFTVILAVNIPSAGKRWHLYSITQGPGGPIRTQITVRSPSEFHLAGPVTGSEPEFADDPNFGIVTETYSDSAIFSIPLASATTARGKNHLVLSLYYQTCNDRYCLPPTTDTLGADVNITGTPVARAAVQPAPAGQALLPAPAAADTLSQTPSRRFGTSTLPGHGSLTLFLWIAATMGALSLLTPCVFPMVPITVSYFSRSGSRSRVQALGDATVYAIGIVVAFTSLGLGLALVLGATGLNRFASNPWLNLAIATLFAAFALSLFGAFNLVVSGSIITRIDALTRESRVGRHATTLLMGATFALTSFTCTAPFVGTLLVSAAQGSWAWPALGLLAFSSVFALPFLLLALAPEMLSRLPRSGGWMVTLKAVLGFVELAAALKFISNADLVLGWGVFTRTVVLVTWLLLGVVTTLYLLGLRISSQGVGRGQTHVAPAAVAAAVAAWLAVGVGGRRLGELEAFLPPAGNSAIHSELPWILNDYPHALAQAQAEGKFVLIDFTGYTCTNCRWMEANMFPKPAVRVELEKFVRVRLFTDGRDTSNVLQQSLEEKMYGTVALPLYGIVNAGGESRGQFLGMTRDAAEFAGFLSGGSSRAK